MAPATTGPSYGTVALAADAAPVSSSARRNVLRRVASKLLIVGAVAVVAVVGVAATSRPSPAALVGTWGHYTPAGGNITYRVREESNDMIEGVCEMSAGNTTMLSSALCSVSMLYTVAEATTNDMFGCGQNAKGHFAMPASYGSAGTRYLTQMSATFNGVTYDNVEKMNATVRCRERRNTTQRTLGCLFVGGVGNIAGDCELCGISTAALTVVSDDTGESYHPYPYQDTAHECSGEYSAGCYVNSSAPGGWLGCDDVRGLGGLGCPYEKDSDCDVNTTQNCFPCFGVTCEQSGPDAWNSSTSSREIPGDLWMSVCSGALECEVTAINVNASDDNPGTILWTMRNDDGLEESMLVTDYDTGDTSYSFVSSELKVLASCDEQI
jgi:hypothetical protein